MLSKTGTREWAERTCNVQVGCEHDCKYCYAKSMAIRFGRATAESWRTPTPAQVRELPSRRSRAITMFPSAHDITPRNSMVCRSQVNCILQSHDNLLLVSKGRRDSLRTALECVEDKSRVEVRVTIGSCDDGVLKFWEPGAPSFEERRAALEWMHGLGFKTSVSMEPMLDANPLETIAAVLPWVRGDVWIGKARQLTQRVAVNCPGDRLAAEAARRLDACWSDERVLALMGKLQSEPWVKWKDSMREVWEKRLK